MAENDPSSGSTSSALSAKKFYMVVSIVKRNGISFGANSYQKFVFFGPPYYKIFASNKKLKPTTGSSPSYWSAQSARVCNRKWNKLDLIF